MRRAAEPDIIAGCTTDGPVTYETRLQIGDYFLTIDIEGNPRIGYGAAIFFERAADLGRDRSPAVKHTLPGRHGTDRKAHQAAFQYAAAAVRSHDTGL